MAYFKKTQCEECEEILFDKTKKLDFHTFLLYFKEYKESDVGGLKWPSEDFFIYMKKLGKAYFNCINIYFQRSNILGNICVSLKEVTSDIFKAHQHKMNAENFIIRKFATMMLKNKIK